tara:strand:- start:1109 stop:1360 length:252 start_codon:yes stop_codon:yes gene_type:complete
VITKEGSPLNWLFSKLHTDSKYGVKSKRLKGRKAKVDDQIKYCNSCERCYQIELPERNIIYYENFPRIGKEKRRCKICINLNR